jgi:excisionase family DNA binding protein
MRVQANVPGHAQAGEDAVVPEALLEAVVRAVTRAIYGYRPQLSAPSADEDGRPDLPPLLAPQQAADLFGISRNTIDRMAEDGELPSVSLREGTRQRMVRIPKAFVLAMLSDLNRGMSIPSLRDYAARWQASLTAGTAGLPGSRLDAAEGGVMSRAPSWTDQTHGAEIRAVAGGAR